MRAATGRPGASRGRAARLLAAVCMAVGLLAGGAAAGSPAVAASAANPAGWAAQCGAAALGLGQDTVQLAPVLSSDTLPGGGHIVPRPLSNGAWVPVIMVHGWTSQDTNDAARTGTFSHYIDLSDIPGFAPDITRSLIGQLQRIPGAAVFTFDYHPYSARWVDDQHLGPALGKVIDCLYRASGQKVIIVAHSMGGLIARYAAARRTVRAGEISSVVTFGTPETGSVAALLTATGVDIGATVSDELAVIRFVLAACGQLASGDIKTGSLCDTLPTPVRAFASDAGIALRAGSSQLAALQPWPSSIHLTALAGNATFELPDPGWFSLPWDTTAVDVGDMIVTRGSALAGSAATGNATCDYELNLVRGATDQVGVWLGLTAKSQVAQQPLGSFAGACFHTNLMRGIELDNDAYAAVSADIASRGPVTAQELLSAPVPASCEHPAGRLVNGVLPGIPANHGQMELAWLSNSLLPKSAGTAFGDLNGDGTGDAATVLYCNAGDGVLAGHHRLLRARTSWAEAAGLGIHHRLQPARHTTAGKRVRQADPLPERRCLRRVVHAGQRRCGSHLDAGLFRDAPAVGRQYRRDEPRRRDRTADGTRLRQRPARGQRGGRGRPRRAGRGRAGRQPVPVLPVRAERGPDVLRPERRLHHAGPTRQPDRGGWPGSGRPEHGPAVRVPLDRSWRGLGRIGDAAHRVADLAGPVGPNRLTGSGLALPLA